MDSLEPENKLSILPIPGCSSIQTGDNLAKIISQKLLPYFPLTNGDCLIIDSKIVSISRGSIEILTKTNTMDQVVARESKHILRRMESGMLSETNHGFICENAGVVVSQTDENTVILLPKDPDRVAHGIRNAIKAEYGFDVAVIISGSLGRPFRKGKTNVALGYSGLNTFPELNNQKNPIGSDSYGNKIAIADELASAGGLVLHASPSNSVVLVRGLPSFYRGNGSGSDLLRNLKEELFR